jgi:molybdate transport system ATP-binding protein
MSTLAIAAHLERPGFRLAIDTTLELRGVTALYGPSGSGKTSLLRVVSGLEKAPGNRIEFDGVVWQSASTWVPPHHRHVGYVFQESRLFPHLDVRANLRFPMRVGNGPKRIAYEDVVDALDLHRLLDQRPGALSGGEQQRVAIGRTLLSAPQLLLMDEPLSSLDTRRKREVIPYVEALPGQFGMPILYVTHDADEVTRLADRMLVLDDGRMAATGDVADVFERIDLAGLSGQLGNGSVLRGRVLGRAAGLTTISVDEQLLRIPGIDRPRGATMRLRIRSRDVVVATSQPENLSIRNILEATVIRADRVDDVHVELLLDIGSQHLRARITSHALEELGLAAGQHVFALIKSVALESLL